MKPIERYIQFAIDNGFNVKEYLLTSDSIKKWVRKGFETTATVSDIELITYKKFIEAIARGKPNGVGFQSPFCRDIDKITWKQAESIRDDKLDEFINNLLGEGKT